MREEIEEKEDTEKESHERDKERKNLIKKYQQLAIITSTVIYRGVHGSSWVGVRGFFDQTHHGGSKKIQPNPTHMGQVESMGWKNFIIIIIIIKLNRKKYQYKYIKKPKDQYQCNSLKVNNTND